MRNIAPPLTYKVLQYPSPKRCVVCDRTAYVFVQRRERKCCIDCDAVWAKLDMFLNGGNMRVTMGDEVTDEHIRAFRDIGK